MNYPRKPIHPNRSPIAPGLLTVSILLLVAACGPSPEAQATMTATIQTATAAAWTETSTPTNTETPTTTFTPTLTDTPTSTYTPTSTDTPTITSTPTITLTPTFDYPKVTVNKAAAACKYGPAKPYLWASDLKAGDTGIVWGRAPYGSSWLYVKWDRFPRACWVSPSVVDVFGDVNRMIVERIRLPITNALYKPPANVTAERQGDQVTVTWDRVWMTEDDDRGYFLEVWVCQGGNLVWVPASQPNQYLTLYTFTDQPGCSTPSHGEIRTVEKHGLTDAVPIPWPPFVVSAPETNTPTDTPLPIVDTPTYTPTTLTP